MLVENDPTIKKLGDSIQFPSDMAKSGARRNVWTPVRWLVPISGESDLLKEDTKNVLKEV